VAEHQPNHGQNLADQVTALAAQVSEEVAHRAKVTAGHVERQAKVDAWLSKERAVLIALIVALPIFGILLVTLIQGRSLAELLTPAPSPAIALQQAQENVDAVVKRIESFRKDFSKLPDTLAVVGVPASGNWTYTTSSGDHYQVVLKLYGQVVTFDSRQPRVGS
jgi:hypothetical protein